MTTIDAFSLSTIPIQQFANGNCLGSATAFVWRRGARHFLITNWHVVTGRNAETGDLMLPVRPETLRAQFTTRVQDFWRAQREISLYGPNGDSIWYVHPQFQKKRIDVVAIPLDSAINDDPEIGLYPINSLRSDVDLQIAIGMDVFVLGYPFGFSLPGLPIWKRGSVASEPDIVHLADGYLLIDTASRPGMSGAPVIRRSWGAHPLAGGGTSSNSTPQSKFVGVYSGRRHTKDSADAQLGMVWMKREVEDIVSLERLED